MLYILAGTYEQAARWAHRRNIGPAHWTYIVDAKTLSGCWGNIAFVGSWRQRKGLRDVIDAIHEDMLNERLVEFTGNLPYIPRKVPQPETTQPYESRLRTLFRECVKIWSLVVLAGLIYAAIRMLSR